MRAPNPVLSGFKGDGYSRNKMGSPEASKEKVENEYEIGVNIRHSHGSEESAFGQDIVGMDANTSVMFQLNEKEESSVLLTSLGRPVGSESISVAESRAAVESVEVSETIYNEDEFSSSGLVEHCPSSNLV
ncbi:hypothetical protein ACOSQ2_012541 [Xanthoceras sorbifolium]